MDIEFEGICYVVVQCNRSHPIAEHQHRLVWYPERALSVLGCVQYRPFVKSIVTENPWIISCYPNEKVRIWKKDFREIWGWHWPDDQTYGKSVNGITMGLLGVRQTIPSIAYDGGKEIEKLIATLDESYA